MRRYTSPAPPSPAYSTPPRHGFPVGAVVVSAADMRDDTRMYIRARVCILYTRMTAHSSTLPHVAVRCVALLRLRRDYAASGHGFAAVLSSRAVGAKRLRTVQNQSLRRRIIEEGKSATRSVTYGDAVRRRCVLDVLLAACCVHDLLDHVTLHVWLLVSIMLLLHSVTTAVALTMTWCSVRCPSASVQHSKTV